MARMAPIMLAPPAVSYSIFHTVGGLDRNPSGVEGDALADGQHRVFGAPAGS
jgi:hypothetical protein